MLHDLMAKNQRQAENRVDKLTHLTTNPDYSLPN